MRISHQSSPTPGRIRKARSKGGCLTRWPNIYYLHKGTARQPAGGGRAAAVAGDGEPMRAGATWSSSSRKPRAPEPWLNSDPVLFLARMTTACPTT
jgi:hypothetical protein